MRGRRERVVSLLPNRGRAKLSGGAAASRKCRQRRGEVI